MTFHTYAHTIPAAYSLLPERMQSPNATAMLLAIGLQESEFAARRQLPKGPARGFWQFERAGGVVGVLEHRSTAHAIKKVLEALQYPVSSDSYTCHTAIEHNDVLACCFARLLLWTLPTALPGRLEIEVAWDQYLDAWRPGKPHVETWPDNFAMAWSIVSPELNA